MKRFFEAVATILLVSFFWWGFEPADFGRTIAVFLQALHQGAH